MHSFFFFLKRTARDLPSFLLEGEKNKDIQTHFQLNTTETFSTNSRLQKRKQRAPCKERSENTSKTGKQ